MASLNTLLEAVHGSLEEAWKRYPQLDRNEFSSEDLREIGSDAVEVAVGNLFWLMALGEHVRAPDIADKTGRQVGDIVKCVRDGRIIGLIGRRQTFLPVWQFSNIGNLELHPATIAILEEFRAELGDIFRPDYVISWTSTRQPELRDRTPRDLVAKGGSADELRRAAHAAAIGLAR